MLLSPDQAPRRSARTPARPPSRSAYLVWFPAWVLSTVMSASLVPAVLGWDADPSRVRLPHDVAGGSRRVTFIHERSALGDPAGRAHRRGRGCGDAWSYPVVDGGFGWVDAGAGQDFNFQEAATKTVTEAVASTLDPSSEVRVRAQVTQGIAAQVLLDACDGADLLVVGQPRARRFHRSTARFGQPALRASRILPRGRHPRPGPRPRLIGATAAAGQPVPMASCRPPDSHARQVRALLRWQGVERLSVQLRWPRFRSVVSLPQTPVASISVSPEV